MYNTQHNISMVPRTAKSIRDMCKREQLYTPPAHTDTSATEQWVANFLVNTLPHVPSFKAIWQHAKQHMDSLAITDRKARRAHYHRLSQLHGNAAKADPAQICTDIRPQITESAPPLSAALAHSTPSAPEAAAVETALSGAVSQSKRSQLPLSLHTLTPTVPQRPSV